MAAKRGTAWRVVAGGGAHDDDTHRAFLVIELLDDCGRVPVAVRLVRPDGTVCDGIDCPRAPRQLRRRGHARQERDGLLQRLGAYALNVPGTLLGAHPVRPIVLAPSDGTLLCLVALRLHAFEELPALRHA